MKFEFDHRSGMMTPRKNDDIYFAQSQGGGLIVDDKKNNVRYIVERSGKITKLFGSFRGDSLNMYDMKDARMIADRVVRLLGREHKYSDFHYFLRGYHMTEGVVRKCSDFLDESVWGEMRKKSLGNSVRKEDGEVIGKLPDGTNLILPNIAFSKGELYEIENERNFTNFNLIDVDFDDLSDYNNVIYAAVMVGDKEDTYYLYDENADGPVNMVEWFTTDSALRNDNFSPLLALIKNCHWDADDLDGLIVTSFGRYFKIKNKYIEEFYVFWNEDYAKDHAIDQERDFLESERFRKEDVERLRNALGDGFFDEKSIENELRESQSSYYDDLSEEDAINLLLDYKIIEETDEYFEVDEDGDVDKSLPKFNYADYEDEYIDKFIDGINDIIETFFSEYGYDNAEDYMDLDELAKLIVENDGVASVLASEDGEQREEKVNGSTYYIYMING